MKKKSLGLLGAAALGLVGFGSWYEKNYSPVQRPSEEEYLSDVYRYETIQGNDVRCFFTTGKRVDYDPETRTFSRRPYVCVVSNKKDEPLMVFGAERYLDLERLQDVFKDVVVAITFNEKEPHIEGSNHYQHNYHPGTYNWKKWKKEIEVLKRVEEKMKK